MSLLRLKQDHRHICDNIAETTNVKTKSVCMKVKKQTKKKTFSINCQFRQHKLLWTKLHLYGRAEGVNNKKKYCLLCRRFLS